MNKPPATTGLKLLALFSANLDASVAFYTKLLGMRIIWQPDADNVYLTSGSDNLALHRAPHNFQVGKHQHLDHLGFTCETPEDVDAWYQFLKQQDVKILTQPKTHRDNARSFYLKDPDGNTVQMIYLDY